MKKTNENKVQAKIVPPKAIMRKEAINGFLTAE
jgi:hypothetical protein